LFEKKKEKYIFGRTCGFESLSGKEMAATTMAELTCFWLAARCVRWQMEGLLTLVINLSISKDLLKT